MTLSTRLACALIVVLALAPPTFYIIFFDAPLGLLLPGASPRLLSLLFLVPFLFMARAVYESRRRNSESPLADLKAAFAEQWKRMLAVAAFLVLIAIVSKFFSYNKNLIDTFVPFYLDPYLAKLEYQILFGSHPWEVTHWVFGDQATVLIDRLYVTWFFIVPALIGAVILSRDTAFQIKTALSLYFTWIVLGSFLAIAFSSVGPVFYEHFYGDPMFEPLNSKNCVGSMMSVPSRSRRSRNGCSIKGARADLGQGFRQCHRSMSRWHGYSISSYATGSKTASFASLRSHSQS